MHNTAYSLLIIVYHYFCLGSLRNCDVQSQVKELSAQAAAEQGYSEVLVSFSFFFMAILKF